MAGDRKSLGFAKGSKYRDRPLRRASREEISVDGVAIVLKSDGKQQEQSSSVTCKHSKERRDSLVIYVAFPNRIVYRADAVVIGKDNNGCQNLAVVCLVLHCPLNLNPERQAKPAQANEGMQVRQFTLPLCFSRLSPAPRHICTTS